jgi:hypothetical protein
MDSVSIKRIRCGEPIEEQSLEHPLHCAAFCLAALKFQAELLGLRNLEPARIAGTGAEEVLSWLRTQTEFIKQVVREAPRDVVVLPTEQLDGAQSPATEMKTPGSQTDRDTLPREDLELDVDLDEIDIPVTRAPITKTLGGSPTGPVEDPLEAGNRGELSDPPVYRWAQIWLCRLFLLKLPQHPGPPRYEQTHSLLSLPSMLRV